MNIDFLKTEWNDFNYKIEAAQKINDRLIESIIKEKSLSRVDAIRNQYRWFFGLLAIEFIFMIAVLAGNPFDFTYPVQFTPYVLLAIGMIIAFFNLLHLYKKLNPSLSGNSVGAFLERIVEQYENNKRFEKWFGVIFLSIALLMPLSFLPQKLDRNPVSTAVGETLLMMGITLVLYLLAFWAGAFKNKHTQKFQGYLSELNELKTMSSELKSNA